MSQPANIRAFKSKVNYYESMYPHPCVSKILPIYHGIEKIVVEAGVEGAIKAVEDKKQELSSVVEELGSFPQELMEYQALEDTLKLLKSDVAV